MPTKKPDPQPGSSPFVRPWADAHPLMAWFQALYDTPFLLSGIVDEHGTVIGANHTAVEGCGLVRSEVIGRPFWECGLWSPDAALSERVRDLVLEATRTGQPFRVRTPYFLGDGTRRQADVALTPFRDPEGGVTFLVATGLDITDALAAQAAKVEQMTATSSALQQVAAAQRATIAQSLSGERRAAERLRRLASVTLELAAVQTVRETAEAIVDRGLSVLGASGGSVLVREPDGHLQVALSHQLGPASHVRFGVMPADSNLPGPTAIRTGERVVLPDRTAALEFGDHMGVVLDLLEREAMVAVPLMIGDRVMGALTVMWAQPQTFSADDLALIEAFAAQAAQALYRIEVAAAQGEVTRQLQQFAEALQRGLLTQPPTPPSLQVAVRYQAAAQEAQIGGDWYDAFVTTYGTTLLVVGDIAGHDRLAAAAMGQVRNLLRGIAYDSDDSPALLLTRLDAAIQGLAVDALATAVVARVELSADVRKVRWSNAGHLPPILRTGDGAVHVLTGQPELLLGLDPTTGRTEQVVELDAGSTSVLYTDGLVERRSESIDVGIDWLAGVVRNSAGLAAEELCDLLLNEVRETSHDDDLALLVLRCT